MSDDADNDDLGDLRAWRAQVVARWLHAAWERFWFYVFLTPVALINTFVGLVAWIGDLMDPFGNWLPQTVLWAVLGWAFKGAGFFIAVLGGIGLAQLAWRHVRPRSDFELRPCPQETGANLRGFTGSTDPILIASGANGAVAINAAVGLHLDIGRHRTALMTQRYEWPDDLQFAARLARREMDRLAVNEHKLGLRTEVDSVFCSGNQPVILQKTRYFFDRTTNDILPKAVFARSPERLAWRGRSHFISDDERLIRLEDASASNQLGGSTLLIDQSRNVYLTRQTTKSAESAGLLAPTGSGSFDRFRYQARTAQRPGLTFQEFCRGEIQRELFEETDTRFCAPDLRTFLIGFGRYLYRGGKPEVFAASALRRTSAQMRVSEKERLWTEGHTHLPLDELLSWNDEELRTVSAPLAANILVLCAFLNSPRGESFWAFLDGTPRAPSAP